jgi:MSHA biogenesis protein MshN
MSVINQVLKELDKRQAQEGGKCALTDDKAPSTREMNDSQAFQETAAITQASTGFVRPQVAFESKLTSVSNQEANSAKQANAKPVIVMSLALLLRVLLLVLLLVLGGGFWLMKQAEPMPESQLASTANTVSKSKDEVQQEPEPEPELSTDEALKASEERLDVPTTVTSIIAVPPDSTGEAHVNSDPDIDTGINRLAIEASDTHTPKTNQADIEIDINNPSVKKLDVSAIDVSAIKVTEAEPSAMAVTQVVLTLAQRVEKLLLKAENAETEGQFAEAMDTYSQVLSLLPTQAEARKKLAALHYGQGELLQALGMMNQGIALAPNQWEWYLLKAKIQQAQGDAKGALTTLSLVPNESLWAKDKWAAQGDIGQKIADYALAETAYLSLSTLESHKGLWWMGLGYAQDSQQNYQQAVQSYQRALTASGLSQSAQEYIKNRLVQLGESR